MELTGQAHRLGGAGVDARGHRRGRIAGAASRRAQAPAPRPVPESESNAWTRPQLEDLWDRHGGSAYALACALLGEEAAAAKTVTLAMADLVLETDSESPEDALRSLARRVYWRSQEVPVEPAGMRQTPSVMVWLGQLAHLQRACLALCAFGGLTHREAADLLDVPPRTVAELLTAGLRELGQLAAAGAPTSA